MNDIIFNVPPTQGATIWIPILGCIPVNSPLVGSFLGVFAAFGLKWLYQLYRNKQDKKDYTYMFGSEIQQCINILEQETVQRLPDDRWTSAINSGALKLFNIDGLTSLSIDYGLIKNYNDIMVRSELIGEHWKPLKNLDTSMKMVHQILENRDWLLEKLKKLENAEYLKRKSWWQF